MRQLSDLLEEIPRYQPGADTAQVRQAYEFSKQAHAGQQRLTGQPYVSHPLEVAGILVDFKMDTTTVTAALLHDVLEDTKATYDDLKATFGPDVANLVDGVTKIG